MWKHYLSQGYFLTTLNDDRNSIGKSLLEQSVLKSSVFQTGFVNTSFFSNSQSQPPSWWLFDLSSPGSHGPVTERKTHPEAQEVSCGNTYHPSDKLPTSRIWLLTDTHTCSTWCLLFPVYCSGNKHHMNIRASGEKPPLQQVIKWLALLPHIIVTRTVNIKKRTF